MEDIFVIPVNYKGVERQFEASFTGPGLYSSLSCRRGWYGCNIRKRRGRQLSGRHSTGNARQDPRDTIITSHCSGYRTDPGLDTLRMRMPPRRTIRPL